MSVSFAGWTYPENANSECYLYVSYQYHFEIRHGHSSNYLDCLASVRTSLVIFIQGQYRNSETPSEAEGEGLDLHLNHLEKRKTSHHLATILGSPRFADLIRWLRGVSVGVIGLSFNDFVIGNFILLLLIVLLYLYFPRLLDGHLFWSLLDSFPFFLYY